MNDSNGPVRGLIYLTAVDRRKEAMTDPVVTTEPTASTPEPVVKAAAIWGTLATGIVTVLGILVALNKVSSEQAAQINQGLDFVTTNLPTLVGTVVGLVGIVSGLAGSAATAAVARRHVKPVRESVHH